MCLAIIFPPEIAHARTVSSNTVGTHNGWDFEFWKDAGGTGSMTLGSGASFTCQWNGINNILFRIGRRLGQNRTHQQIGNISMNFSGSLNTTGNAYLGVYGWTVNPLVEFYIIESWGNWRPPGGTRLGSVTIDGGTYDIFRTTRTNQPSIIGTATFPQFWSVRTSRRTSGTISVTQHFNAWESRQMQMGLMHEVMLLVEGFQSNGSGGATLNSLTMTPPGAITRIEAESMTRSGPHAGLISSPFNGVGLYANNDLARVTHNFTRGTHSFTLRGASSNNNAARVDLRIGGQTRGTFTFSGTTPTTQTLNNISHGTGNQVIELVVTTDNGTWDAFVDWVEFR